jgi:hypothetical protein
MATLEVYDRPMCCSTGVCGPKVDPVLPRFAADLGWLRSRDVAVERFNLSQQPGAFSAHPEVMSALSAGMDCLPLIVVDGKIVSRGNYPSRETLAAWAGVESAASLPVTEHRSPSGCC